MARGHMQDGAMERSCAKGQSTRIGHRRRSAWPRGIEIDSKKSWAPPGTFMGVRPHPDPDEGS
jgi:hypothetical protein